MTALQRHFVPWRLALALLAALWVARFLFDPSIVLSSWMHGVVLVIHEAGHFLTPFGEFATLLGGSFWQVMIPLALASYFALTRQTYAAGLLLFLVAFSLADVAVYVADARERQLELLGGNPDNHDWWNLLLILDLFRRDDLLASMFRLQAFIFFVAGVLITLRWSRRDGVTG